MIASVVLAIVAGLFTHVASVHSSVMPWAPSPDNFTNSPIIPPTNRSSNGPIVPNTYIVQLISGEELDPHAQFHRKAKRDVGLSYTTRQTFTQESLFLGLSLTLDSDDDLAALKSLESVANVFPVVEFARPAAFIGSKPLELNKRFATVPVVGTNLTIPYITGDIDVNRPHSMAGVDQVQAAGIKGKGIKIAVIDTGVDFRHPSLGGCFGPGCKVEFGYDFVGNDYPTSTDASPIPLATCIGGGHGTHVMGIFPSTTYAQIGLLTVPQASLECKTNPGLVSALSA
jgi:subtilisin family serine protease